MPEEIEIEVSIAKEANSESAGVMKLGAPSLYACPECHGVLLEMKDATPRRFRCHTGHAYTAEVLLEEMNAAIEDSLWNAIRALEETVLLQRQAAEEMRPRDAGHAAKLLAAAEETQQRSRMVREAVMKVGTARQSRG